MDTRSRTTPALGEKEAQTLARALAAGDVTVFVDGTALRLPPGARDAVLDLLARLGQGATVTVQSVAADSGPEQAEPAPRPGPGSLPGAPATADGAVSAAASGAPGARQGGGAPVNGLAPGAPSAAPLLTTSQAAAVAGISHTYLRNLTDAGVIPVQYRGSHRRIRMEDVQDWLAAQQLSREERRGRSGAS